jgi:hypothetical protein
MRAKENSMRWIVRDLGVFFYGCVFAGQCIFKLSTARDFEKENTRRAAVPVIQRRNLRIA